MKPWMRILVWFGLGGGIGFFAGWQAGALQERKAADEETERLIKRNRELAAQVRGDIQKAEKTEMPEMLNADRVKEIIQREYGADTDGDESFVDPFDEDEPEMPMEEPEFDDPLEDEEEEIPQLHPEDLLPHPITEDEFNRNSKDYEICHLLYYADDDVIFDPDREEQWTHPDQLLGIGWMALFGGRPGQETYEIYIENDTMGCLYKVTRIDDSFHDLYEENEEE